MTSNGLSFEQNLLSLSDRIVCPFEIQISNIGIMRVTNCGKLQKIEESCNVGLLDEHEFYSQTSVSKAKIGSSGILGTWILNLYLIPVVVAETFCAFALTVDGLDLQYCMR
jgi:hypothetical protein